MENTILEIGIYFFLTILLGFIWIKLAKRSDIKEFCSFERFNNKVKKQFKKKEG